MKFCGKMERGPVRNRLDFGGDPYSFTDLGSFFGILYYYKQKSRKLTFCSVSQQVMNGF